MPTPAKKTTPAKKAAAPKKTPPPERKLRAVMATLDIATVWDDGAGLEVGPPLTVQCSVKELVEIVQQLEERLAAAADRYVAENRCGICAEKGVDRPQGHSEVCEQ